MSLMGQKADMTTGQQHVRCADPNNGHGSGHTGCPLSARSGHRIHSITSSAMASSFGKIWHIASLKPRCSIIARAVLHAHAVLRRDHRTAVIEWIGHAVAAVAGDGPAALLQRNEIAIAAATLPAAAGKGHTSGTGRLARCRRARPQPAKS